MTRTEQQIVKRVLTDALAAGYALSVFDGEEYAIKRSRNLTEVLAAMHATDEDWLYCHGSDGKSAGWVRFIYGNDGYDVMADYTVNLEDLLAGAIALSERLERSGR